MSQHSRNGVTGPPVSHYSAPPHRTWPVDGRHMNLWQRTRSLRTSILDNLHTFAFEYGKRRCQTTSRRRRLAEGLDHASLRNDVIQPSPLHTHITYLGFTLSYCHYFERAVWLGQVGCSSSQVREDNIEHLLLNCTSTSRPIDLQVFFLCFTQFTGRCGQDKSVPAKLAVRPLYRPLVEWCLAYIWGELSSGRAPGKQEFLAAWRIRREEFRQTPPFYRGPAVNSVFSNLGLTFYRARRLS
jgi:hypothetical protein